MKPILGMVLVGASLFGLLGWRQEPEIASLQTSLVTQVEESSSQKEVPIFIKIEEAEVLEEVDTVPAEELEIVVEETEAVPETIVPETESPVEETKPFIEKTEPEENVLKSLGNFTLTAYCGCSSCSGGWGNMTATGVTARSNHTIAVDPSVIPYGTEVIIRGRVYVAEDCGGGVNGNHIDIYFDSHSEAIQFGRQSAEVFVKN